MRLEAVSKLMEKVGIPGKDGYELPTSKKRFPDGGWYRMEISGVERPNVLVAVIDEMNKRKIPIHRVISVVMGATLLDKSELMDFAKLAHEAKLEVIITPGPRSAWNTGRQLVTQEGIISGMRFRGSDGLREVITDIMRLIDIGFRGFLVVDEGELWLLNELKKNGNIPQDVVFKVSIYAGHANPASAKLLEMLGASSFNPPGDLTLPQFAALRQAVDIPIDVHIMLTESFGGYIRIYEGAELARICAPCYFKIEPGPACAVGPQALYKPWVDSQMLANWAREKVKHAQIIHEIIQENNPEVKISEPGVPDLAIPVV